MSGLRFSLPVCCVALALGGLVLAVALVPAPPLLDYPNHFARLWLLAGGIEAAPLATIYAIDWSLAWTNIGIDVLAAVIAPYVGMAIFGPFLIAAALVLPPLGAVLLHRSLFGGWHWWQAGFACLAWNSTFLAGFLSFQIGLGIALLAAAADANLRRRVGRRWAMPVRAAVCGVLLIFHVFAAAFYAALLTGLAFGAVRQQLPRGFALAAARGLAVGGISLAVPLLIFLNMAPVVPGGHAPPGVFDIWHGYSVANKVVTLMSAVTTYDFRIDMAFVLALWAVARVMPGRTAIMGHAGLLLVAGGLALFALGVPSVLAGTAGVDWRFPVMAVLTLVAAVRPGFRTARAGHWAACALLALTLLRTGWITTIWIDRSADGASVARAAAYVPAGAAVFPAQNIPPDLASAPRGRYLLGNLPSFWHYPSYLVPWRQAFVPTLFTARGKQPLHVLPPWDMIAVAEGMPAPVSFLTWFEPTPGQLYYSGYVVNWRARFDYVLVLNADMPAAPGQAPVPPDLELVADEGFARLYRIPRSR